MAPLSLKRRSLLASNDFFSQPVVVCQTLSLCHGPLLVIHVAVALPNTHIVSLFKVCTNLLFKMCHLLLLLFEHSMSHVPTGRQTLATSSSPVLHHDGLQYFIPQMQKQIKECLIIHYSCALSPYMSRLISLESDHKCRAKTHFTTTLPYA